jgi:hypothetical protein
MPQINVGQQGKLKSTPKMTRINGDDNMKAIYRNMGNNHAYPMLWANEITHSGTETVVLASGTKFHGYDLVSYANVTATPLSDPGTGRYWIDKNADGAVYIKSSASLDNVIFNVKIMLGEDFDYSAFNCRGNTGAAPSLP